MGTISSKLLSKKVLSSLVWGGFALAAAAGCNNDSGDADDMGGDPGAGGSVSGGGPNGGASVGGSSGPSGGAPSGGGPSVSGGGPSGGASSGGSASGGGPSGGGPVVSGGAPSGGAPSGGMGGDDMGGQGGEGGAPPEEECGGCAKLFVPFTAANTSQFFYIGFPSAVDLSESVVTVRLKGETTASDIYVQVLLNNGAPNYVSAQPGWVSLGGFADFGNLTFDVNTVPLPADPDDFDPSQIVMLNIQVVAGANATAGDTTVWVDSITFSDGATPNYTFDTDVQGFAASNYNPIAGSTVSFQE